MVSDSLFYMRINSGNAFDFTDNVLKATKFSTLSDAKRAAEYCHGFVVDEKGERL